MYSLWDIRTFNLVADFPTKREALQLVLDGIERNGPEDTATLTLEGPESEGEDGYIAHGSALAELAHRELGVPVRQASA